MIRACGKDKVDYVADNKLDERKLFYTCPCCNEYVFLKKDDKNPQFYHYNGFDSHEWERNSTDHTFMVKEVYDYFSEFEWIKDIKINESVNEDIDLIPDIYIITNTDNKIAVECQLSNYSKEIFIEKTEKYSSGNIHSIWIFHDSLLKTIGRNKDYFYSVYNKIGSGNNILKNIVISRFYIFNSKSNFITYKNNIEPVYISDNNINDLFDSGFTFNDEDEIKKNIKKRNDDILGNYPSLFSLDHCSFIDKDGKYIFLKSMYNKMIKFNDFNKLNFSNTLNCGKSIKMVFDYEFPTIDDILYKLLYKYSENSMISMFDDVVRIW